MVMPITQDRKGLFKGRGGKKRESAKHLTVHRWTQGTASPNPREHQQYHFGEKWSFSSLIFFEKAH